MNPINILIEGPDCAGKSTAVHRIKNALHWDAKALHHREGNQFCRYLKEYALAQHTVFDRGHFSQEVYSRLWRGGTPFSVEEKIILDKLCSSKFLVIYVDPGIKIIQRRYQKRKYPQQIKWEELQRSLILFEDVMNNKYHLLYHAQSYRELDQLIQIMQKLVR